MSFLNAFALAVILLGILARGQMSRDTHRQLMRGRWVSRPAVRALGYLRALIIRGLLCLSIVTMWASWLLLALVGVIPADGTLLHTWLTAAVVESIWDIDDWLTGDDDSRRRKPLAWARARLQGALRPLGYSTSTGGRA